MICKYMGYHVAILRTKNGQQESISIEEVKEAIVALHGFKLKPASPPWKDCYEISFPSSEGEDIVLLWQEGEIWTKNPEDQTMQGMLDLAKKLNARVRGDELETYKTIDESYQHPDDFPGGIPPSRHNAKRPTLMTRLSRGFFTDALFVGKTKRTQMFLKGVIFVGAILYGLMILSLLP